MTLLCIDDDNEDLELFREALRTINSAYVCIGASNGLQGLQVLNNILPDLVFLDINMPVMGGKETLQTIRRDVRFKHIPIYILSTSTNSSEIELFKQLGALSFFTKPNSFEELCRILNTLLSSIKN